MSGAGPGREGPAGGAGMSGNTITVSTAYLDSYNAIVQPEKIFPVSRYFLKYWLPALTPATAWLIVELRQRAYLAGGGEFQIDQASLARGAAIGTTRLRQILNVDVDQFVNWSHETKYLADYNRNVHDKNRYVVFADEPLAPIHVAGMLSMFINDAGHVTDTIRELVDADAETMLKHIEVMAGDTFATSGLLTVADVFASATGQPARGDVAGLCSKLQRRVIAAAGGDVITTQYFRRRWLPLLGHALAWLVVVARSHCFDDGKTRRDTFTIEKSELAGEIGQSVKNLTRLMERAHASEFVHVDESTQHTLTLNVRTWQSLGEVLTPGDWDRWQAALAGAGIEPDKCVDGKPGKPDKCVEHVADKCVYGKPGKLDKCVEHLNTPTTKKIINTITTPPSGGDDDVVSFLKKLGVNQNSSTFAGLIEKPELADSGYRKKWISWDATANRDANGDRIHGTGWIIRCLESGAPPPAPAPQPPAPKIYRADPDAPAPGAYNQNPRIRAMIINASRGQFNTT